MRLLADWRLVVGRAWSFRLMALAVLLSALEVGLPFYAEVFPPWLFAGLSGLVVVAAMLARVVAQDVFEGRRG